ncbi:MAG: hypothetical protein M3Y56_01865 [Armatimonadota bacterium]|nr:hypothetical protein [Armatimonadota bacterium]
MLLSGWFLILVSLVHFYRFDKALHGNNEKMCSYAWLILVTGITLFLTGARYVYRASGAPSSHSANTLSVYSGTTLTITDPNTGSQKTVPLTNEDMKEFRSNMSGVLSRKAIEAR